MSEAFDLVAIGGGPAALSAVRAYRDAGGTGDVALITDENRIPYQRPPLTKELLRGEQDESELELEEEFWFWREGVRLVCGRAMRLDPHAREIVLAGGRTLQYRSCVVATGAEPTRPPIPGVDDPAVLVLRSLEDLHQLLARLTTGQEVVVVGSGFLGCEIAASLRVRRHPVSLISDESAPNRRRLGADAADTIATWLDKAGVFLTFDATISEIERRDGELHVVSDRGRLHASVVVLATGVVPRTQFLSDQTVTDVHGAIVVDDSMQTTVPGLLAAGDVASAHNQAAGRPLRVEHWGDALRQGQIAGRSAAGRSDTWNEVPGFWTTIAEHVLKYAAWGDGYDISRVTRSEADDAFTVWYGRDDTIVGVLTHNADADYERGSAMIQQGARWVD